MDGKIKQLGLEMWQAVVVVGGAALQEKVQEFSFGHVDSEMFIRHSCRAGKVIRYIHLNFEI